MGRSRRAGLAAGLADAAEEHQVAGAVVGHSGIGPGAGFGAGQRAAFLVPGSPVPGPGVAQELAVGALASEQDELMELRVERHGGQLSGGGRLNLGTGVVRPGAAVPDPGVIGESTVRPHATEKDDGLVVAVVHRGGVGERRRRDGRRHRGPGEGLGCRPCGQQRGGLGRRRAHGWFERGQTCGQEQAKEKPPPASVESGHRHRFGETEGPSSGRRESNPRNQLGRLTLYR